MEGWRCDLCGSTRAEAFCPHVVRCLGCSLVATHPQPERLQERYGEGYYAGWTGSGRRAKLWESRLALLQGVVGSGRLLDVGCGSGEFLAAARAAGFDASGTEFSAAARRLMKGGPVYERPAAAPGLFDVVTMWHVLEHTPSPRAVLGEVREKLKPGGRLVLAVPNVDSHWFDLVYRCVKLKRNPLYAPDNKEPHLFHFSTRTLGRYLAECGFAVERRGLDVPDYADRRKLLVDVPARALYRLTGVNWALTQFAAARKA